MLALKQTAGGLTYGFLANHLWSVAGEDSRAEISSTFLQPFLAKQFPGARTLTLNFESTYDWYGEAWNVPMNLTYSKVMRLGKQTVSFAGGARYYFNEFGDNRPSAFRQATFATGDAQCTDSLHCSSGR